MSTRLKKVVMATGNPGKLREIQRLLEDLDVEVIAQSELGVTDADETGTTFAANSLIKAEHAAAATGLPAIADDSGLSVDALGGRPGVYSARYAGLNASDQDNVTKLLKALEHVPKEERTARFKCVLCIIDQAGLVTYCDGSCEGQIATMVSGKSGFGYDPVFIPDGYEQSFAALGRDVKDRLSHRARAVRALRSLLR